MVIPLRGLSPNRSTHPEVVAKKAGRWDNGLTATERTGKMTTLYIHCWKCGEAMEVAERDYTHGKVCGQC